MSLFKRIVMWLRGDTADTAHAIIIHDGSVLLLMTPEGGWQLPGGHVRFGEDHSNALFREVKEETKIMVNDRNLWAFKLHTSEGIYDFSRHDLAYRKGHLRTFWFVPTASKAPVTLSNEHRCHGWFDLNEHRRHGRFDLNDQWGMPLVGGLHGNILDMWIEEHHESKRRVER